VYAPPGLRRTALHIGKAIAAAAVCRAAGKTCSIIGNDNGIGPIALQQNSYIPACRPVFISSKYTAMMEKRRLK
jgi:hypothetical protein